MKYKCFFPLLCFVDAAEVQMDELEERKCSYSTSSKKDREHEIVISIVQIYS